LDHRLRKKKIAGRKIFSPGRFRLYALTVLGLVLAGLLTSGFAVFAKPDYDRLNFMQRFVVCGVLAKWLHQVKTLPEEKRVLVDYNHLLGQLNVFEKSVVQRIFAINPREFGFKGPLHSLEKPDNLVKIMPQAYKRSGQEGSTGIQYCPAASYNDYLRMMARMRQELGRELFIESGYRSPGFQAYAFLLYLVRNHDFSLRKAARLNALPGYSEHQDPVNNALDFINADGVNGDEPQTPEDFERLPEYQWLLKHAHKFNFYLSYPRDNQWGVSFEPWHWHWQKPASPNSGKQWQ
jgi:hypothetical protein